MASTVSKTIDIIFRGVDKTSDITNQIAGNIDSFAGSVDKLVSPMASAANKALLLEASIVAVGSAMAGYAYISAAKFESAQLGLQKVMDETEGKVSDYNKEIYALSNTFGVSTSAVISSAENFKVAGFTMKESLDLVQESIKLMIAGDVDAAQASQLLVQTLKGFKAPASEAARLVDILNEVSNEYATNVGELGIGMAKLSPVANQMGLSFEETAGVLTPIIEVFQSGSEAANALKVGMLKLLDDSKPVQTALAAIGVSQKDANGQFRQGKDILYDVARAFQGLEENEKLYFASQLVGINQAGRVIEVFNGLDKAMAVTETAIQGFANNSAWKEVEIRLDSTEIALQRAGVAFENIAISLGTKLQGSFTSVIQEFTGLEAAIAKAIGEGALDPLIDALDPFIEKFRETLKIMADNLPAALEGIDFSGLIDSLGDLGDQAVDAFEAVFGDIDLRSVEGLTSAVQKVVDAFETLTRISSGIISAWQPVLEFFGDMIDKTIDAEDETKQFIGSIGGYAQILKGAAENVGLLTGALELLGQGLSLIGAGSILNTAIGSLGELQTALGGVTSTATKAIGIGVAFTGGWQFGTWLREEIPAIDDYTQKMIGAADSLLNFTGTQTDKVVPSLEETAKKWEEIRARWNEAAKDVEKVEAEATFKVNVDALGPGADAMALSLIKNGQIVEGYEHLSNLSEEALATIVLETEVSEPKLKEAVQKINTEMLTVTGEGGKIYEIEVELDPKLDKKKVDEETNKIPTEKELEIKLKGEIDEKLLRVEQEFMTIRELADIQAKVDIAQIEAATARIQSAFESVNVGIESTGDTIASLAGNLSGASLSEKYNIQDYIEREYKFREQEFELQKQLAQSTMSLNTAKRKFFAGEGGTATISIESSGVYPELELVLESLIRKSQIKANALGLAALIGLNTLTGGEEG